MDPPAAGRLSNLRKGHDSGGCIFPGVARDGGGGVPALRRGGRGRRWRRQPRARARRACRGWWRHGWRPCGGRCRGRRRSPCPTSPAPAGARPPAPARSRRCCPGVARVGPLDGTAGSGPGGLGDRSASEDANPPLPGGGEDLPRSAPRRRRVGSLQDLRLLDAVVIAGSGQKAWRAGPRPPPAGGRPAPGRSPRATVRRGQEELSRPVTMRETASFALPVGRHAACRVGCCGIPRRRIRPARRVPARPGEIQVVVMRAVQCDGRPEQRAGEVVGGLSWSPLSRVHGVAARPAHGRIVAHAKAPQGWQAGAIELAGLHRRDASISRVRPPAPVSRSARSASMPLGPGTLRSWRHCSVARAWPRTAQQRGRQRASPPPPQGLLRPISPS